MKTLSIIFATCLLALSCGAQSPQPLSVEQSLEPYRLEVSFHKTLHLIFPSSVKYVDLGSTDIIAGKADGVENVVRVKAAVEKFATETNFSVITSDGSFYSFNVVYSDEPSSVNINIGQWTTHGQPVPGGGGIQVAELGDEDPAIVRSLMYTIYKRNRRDVKDIGCRQFGMQALLTGIYVHRDLLFLHIGLSNSSNVPFDIDFIRFKIVDKQVARRTAQQETFIEPVRSYNNLTRIDGNASGHMVYAFGKITIPDDKRLMVEIYEKNGGRHQCFSIENSDLVDARLVRELKQQ